MNKLVLLLTILVFSGACSQTQTVSKNTAATDALLASYANSEEPGMAIGIVQNGRIIYKNAIGKADLSNDLPLTNHSTFNIASVSKQFTALLAVMADEENKLSLEDDISMYLPELKHLPYKITVKQLANHTHGLPNYSDLMEMMGFGLSSPISNDQAVETMLSVEQVNFESGSKFQYGNSGFMLLAEILERAYEKPFPELLKEKVF